MALLTDSSLPAGVTGNKGLHLNEHMVSFLGALRKKVDPSISLHVTSAVRTVGEQAAAMKTKRDLGDDLRALYGSKVAPVLAAPNTVAAMSAALQDLANRGVVMSRHMFGDALDLRVRDWSTAQRATVATAVTSLGGKPQFETTPPHLHIEGLGARQASASGGTGIAVGPRYWLFALAGGAVVATLVGVKVVRSRRKSRSAQ
jgi:hypothetical protein